MKKHFIGIFFAFAVIDLNAQTVTPTVISSNGGYSSSPAGSIAWTIGEPLSETKSNTNNMITMGFHQPIISVVEYLSEGTNGQSSVLVYPNPVKDFLQVNFNGMREGNYKLVMTDAAGRIVLVSENEITEHSRMIQLKTEHMASGVYFLNIKHKEFQTTVKINKTL